MARANEQDRIKTWDTRLRASNKLHDKWYERFDIARLEEYYLGSQYAGLSEDEAKKLYCINLVFASVEVNKPALAFANPTVRMQPRPQRGNALGSNAEARARLCQDCVQTFIDDPDFGFEEETTLGLHEAHFAFGVIEVGYTADWIDNPDAGKPVLKEDGETPVKDSKGDPVLQGDVTVQSENLYIKRIPSETFRVSVSSKQKLDRNDYVAYYEWQYVEDVKSNKNYRNTTTLKPTGIVSKDVTGETSTNSDEINKHHGMVKIWKVWDIRRKVKHVIAEGHSKFLLEDVPFKYLPFAVLKFHEQLKSFYPLPPVSQWLGPQDEINETREGQRAHRKRFYRRYTYLDGAIDETELEKLENGGDGVYAKANQRAPIEPVPDAPLDGANWMHLDQSKQDFMTVSSVGGEQRGVAESDTATQASIIDQRSRLRETAARSRVSKWLGQIARLMLLTIRDNMALEFWIKRTTDPIAAAQDPQKLMETQEVWKEIQSEDLGDTDLDVTIDLSSLSPITQAVERDSWNQVLALIVNPTLISILSKSEVILRKTLRLYGVQSENEIQEIKRVMQETQQEMQMMALVGLQTKSAGAASTTGRPGKPPGSGTGGRTVEGNRLAGSIGAATQQ